MTRKQDADSAEIRQHDRSFTDRIRHSTECAKRANEVTNAYSVLDTDRALRAAKQLDESPLMVQNAKPLLGLAVTVKDSLSVPGLPRWHGSATHPGQVPSTPSIPVARLENAGAIIIGKTTMPDYGLLASGISSKFGIIRNPWNLALSPGGSSSGAAVSVAAGTAALAIGTDIAGSVRLPAAHCGITALKPTQGSIAYAPSSTWRSAGPMAKSVAETRTAFDVICGQHASDQLSFDPVNKSYKAQVSLTPSVLSNLRIAVIEWPGYGPTMDTETGSTFEQTVLSLKQQGAVLTTIHPGILSEDFEALDRCLMARCLAELSGCPEELRERLLPQIAVWAEAGKSFSSAQYYTDFEHLSSVASRLNMMFDDYDFIISPVLGDHAFPAEDFGPDTSQPLLYHANYTAWFNQTGQPAVSLPMGLSSGGLPIGLQIAGKRMFDHALLDVAEMIETILDVRLNYPNLDNIHKIVSKNV